MTKYHVYLDTTNLFTSDFKVMELNKPVLDFKKFIDDHGKSNITVYIPEVVLDERIKQNNIVFERYKKSILDSYDKIKESGVRLDLTKFNTFDYEQEIRKKITTSINNTNIQLIPYPAINAKEILKRFFTNQKPFKENSKDEKGFKDTAIWLSILEFSRDKQDDKFIFITQNSADFPIENMQTEFKKETNADIELIYSLEDAQEYFDSVLDLNLEIAQKYNEIRDIISRKIGDILVELHKSKQRLSWSSTSQFVTVYSDKNYLYFKLIKIEYITDIFELDVTTEARISLKLEGYYTPKENNLFGTPQTGLRLFASDFSLNHYSEHQDCISGLYYKNIDAEIDVSINNITNELFIKNIQLRESIF